MQGDQVFLKILKGLRIAAVLVTVAGLSACGVKITKVLDSKSLFANSSMPRTLDFRIMNINGYLNSSTVGLLSTSFGKMDQYCLLVNDSMISHCAWKAGTHFPPNYDSGVSDGPVAITAWARNTLIGYTSDAFTTPTVIIDSTPPVLASVSTSISSPTNQVSNWPLTYGAISEAYASYCVMENDTNVADCSWVSGTLPSTYTVSAGNGAKVISFFLQDAAGNTSTSAASTSSVTVSTIAPTLASFTIGGPNPTNASTAPLTYGSVTGSYNRYCLLINDTTFSNCTFVTGTLPTTLTLATEGTKSVSLWLKDASNNVSARVDSNSVVVDTTPPVLASASLTDTSPTTSQILNLSYGAITGSYSSYCILENSTSIGSCTFIPSLLPSTFTTTAADGAKLLSLWLKDSAGNISTRVDTNSVTLDRTAPGVASFAVTNPSPTKTITYSLSYGAITGTYASYCVLENSTTVGSCTFTSGTVPTVTSQLTDDGIVPLTRRHSDWLRFISA